MKGKSLQVVFAFVAFTSIQLISLSSGSYLLVQLDEEAEPKLPEPPKPSEGYGHKHGVDYNPTHSSITQTARQATADSCTLENNCARVEDRSKGISRMDEGFNGRGSRYWPYSCCYRYWYGGYYYCNWSGYWCNYWWG